MEAAAQLWLVEERVGDGEAESIIAKYTHVICRCRKQRMLANGDVSRM